jgi:serine O-acetyltransferase
MLWDKLKSDLLGYRGRGNFVSAFVKNKISLDDTLEETLIKSLCLELCGDKWISFDEFYPHIRDAYMPSGLKLAEVEDDMKAFYDRDPACRGYGEILLFYKGFFALQSHRIANWFWKNDEKEAARILQKRVSDLFSIDIHPAACIESGIFIDHGTGIVIGETAVVAKDVSILHGVTLGGTGKHSGDRHPKIGKGVLLGANCTILGNITIGAHSKVGAGSVVVDSVPMRCTVAGVPARIVRRGTPLLPSHEMSQNPADFENGTAMDSADLRKKFAQGLTWEQFYRQSGPAKKGFDQVFNALEKEDGILGFLCDLRPLNVFVAGETWCPDVIQHFPLMARLEQWLPGLNVRFFDTKEEPEFLSYLNQGMSKTIPAILFCDAGFKELGIVKGRQSRAKSWMKGRVAGRAAAEIPPHEVESLIHDFNERFCKEFVAETYAEMQSGLQRFCFI